MKLVYFLIPVFTIFNLQIGLCNNTPLWEEFQRLHKDNSTYLSCKPLTAEPAPLQLSSHPIGSQLSCFKIEKEQMDHVTRLKPEHLQFSLVDHKGQTLSFFLVRQSLASEHSRLLSSDSIHNQSLELEGIYYRGVVSEFPGSIAAISFINDEIIGLASIPDQGNLVLGKFQTEGFEKESGIPGHVLYYEKDLPESSGFICGTEDLLLGMQIPDSLYSERCKTVKIFLECDYKLYQDKNRSIVNVKNYISGLFNVVKTLYFNERINIEISDIMVWSVQDPFLHTSLAEILYHYANYRQNNFSGNLAQLLSRFTPQQQGGIAFLGTLCLPYNGQSGPHSYAYINNNYSQLPTYSWSVEVIAHELGHNFGSPHTHACFWGPSRNQTLDNCQPPENNACAPGPAPIGGGTIMSYCHLTGYGINLSKGFGLEPGNLIRNAVQVRSCIAPSFIPSVNPTVIGPYYEGEQVSLLARPSNINYQYNWFHYDYQMPNENDSLLKVKYSGNYKAAISNKCTEYSSSESIVLSDFLVNLGCPEIKGKRDSVKISLVMQVDQGTQRDTLEVPDTLFQSVPPNAIDVLVELHMKISPLGSSWTRDVSSSYTGPDQTRIFSSKFQPNAMEAPLFNGEKSYAKILGRFDPTGPWKFTTNDNKFDNGIDALVEFSIVISWRQKDSIPPCDIVLCDGQSIILDAKIPHAKYKWSTGDSSQKILINNPGMITVEVSRGMQMAMHTVNLVNFSTHYKQNLVLCFGDTLNIGSNRYTTSGLYNDTLVASNGCDSILETQLSVLPERRITENRFLCYGDQFESQSYFGDTIIIKYFSASDGCDSIREYRLSVNPKIDIRLEATPKCPEAGGSLFAEATGGAGGPYAFNWSNGHLGQSPDSLQNGIYTVTISDKNSCADSIDIELINLDSVGITPLVFDVSCFNSKDGKIFIDFVSGHGPFQILWSNGKTTKDIDQLNAGTYSLLVTDNNNCKLERDIDLHSPDSLVVDLEISNSINMDGSAKTTISGGTPPYLILWSNGAIVEEISNLSPGDYWISVYDKNGCNSFIPFKIQQIIGTESLNAPFKIILSPNPVETTLSVELETSVNGPNKSSWTIMSIHGQKMIQLESGRTKFEFEVADLLPGVYLLKVKSDKGYCAQKFIKI